MRIKQKENPPTVDRKTEERILALSNEYAFWQRAKELSKIGFFVVVALLVVFLLYLYVLLPYLRPDCGFCAQSRTQDLVKRVSVDGFGMRVYDRVEFTSRDLTAQDAVRNTGVSPDRIRFICNNATLCGTGKALDVSESKVTVNAKITLTVAVCYNPQKDGIYHVVIDKDAKAARTIAEPLCNLS